MNLPSLAKLAPMRDDPARTRELVALLRSRRRLLVLTHNNPDPDSLGGAVGLQEFAHLAAGIDSKLAITGKVLRAENQAMVRELGIEMELLHNVRLADFDCFALVDTQPGFGHTFVPAGTDIDIVIDHHVCNDSKLHLTKVAFADVRPEIGATSSIVAGHLLRAGLEPSKEVATALMYGIKTDTADLSRNVSKLDLEASEFLSARMDRQKLAAITNPRLPVAYFQTLKDALSKVRLYDGLSLCSLGRTTSAEMVAEVADLLLRMEGVRAVFCGGLVGSSYYVSVRTEMGIDAWSLIKAGMEGEAGSCGGHGSVAGGSIQLDVVDSRTLRRLERRLERNVLRAMGMSGSNAAILGDQDD
ncbi:MAG: DHH family phosphoesterase [Planctomycetes bacterium]|nr:DHH family phosphoesterase [Planctomycetota bacterium]